MLGLWSRYTYGLLLGASHLGFLKETILRFHISKMLPHAFHAQVKYIGTIRYAGRRSARIMIRSSYDTPNVTSLRHTISSVYLGEVLVL
jgi:hypothetical protein